MYEEVAHVPGSPESRRHTDPAKVRGFRVAAYFLACNIALLLISSVLLGRTPGLGLLVIQGALGVWLYRKGRYAGVVTSALFIATALYHSMPTGLPFGVLVAVPWWLHAAAFALALWGYPSRLRIAISIAVYALSMVTPYLMPYLVYSLL